MFVLLVVATNSMIASTMTIISMGESDEQKWVIENVNQQEGGLQNSMVLDSYGNPQIAYFTTYYPAIRRQNLIFTWKDNGKWYSEIVREVNESYPMPTMAVDSQNNPHVIYCGEINGSDGTYYSKKIKDRWYHESFYDPATSPPDMTLRFSLAIDSFQIPQLAYNDHNMDLKYSFKDNGRWVIETLDTNVNEEVELILDSQGSPHIVNSNFEGGLGYAVKYAFRNETGWYSEIVEKRLSRSVSIDVDSFHRPHIAYIDSDGDLKYSFKDNGRWVIETVEDMNSYLIFEDSCSMKLDKTNIPHITYIDLWNEQLKYAEKTSNGWEISTIFFPTHRNDLRSCHLAIDSQGNSHISFFDSSDSTLKYAFRTYNPPEQKTTIKINDVKYKKWNMLNVPFKDTEEANDYIEQFQTEPSSADFGTFKIYALIENTGDYIAEGNIVAKLTGDILMVAYEEEKKTIVPYHFDYEETFSFYAKVGSSINKSLNLQVKYASVISATLEPKDEDDNPVQLDIVISMVAIQVTLTARGNFNEKNYVIHEEILCMGDPGDLLRKWNAELWPKVQEKMLRVFLETYYSQFLNIHLDFQTISNIPTGIYTKPIIIPPGTAKIVVSFLVPKAITLVGLALLPWGATTPVGATLVAVGLAMVVVNNPLPGEATITLETKTAMIQMLETSANMSLEIINIIPNNVQTIDHTVLFSGGTYHVMTTSNSTIIDFLFRKGMVEFNAVGQPDTSGFVYVTIPKTLMNNVTVVYVNGTEAFILRYENMTHTSVYFKYSHTGKITVMPEFSTFVILLMFMTTSLIAVLMKKRNKKH